MHLYCLQLNSTWENKPANFLRARRLLARGNPQKNSLVLLPEMFATGFSMNAPAIAESPRSETTRFLQQLAHDFHIILLAGLVLQKKSGPPQNCALAISPDGKQLCNYAKLHPFALAGEHKHYAPGDTPKTFRCGPFRVAPSICYDLRFPELYRHPFRKSANAPDLLAVIANWPAQRQAHWTTLLQARAIENQSYVAACNRTGSDPHNRYIGGSLIIDPAGKILAHAGPRETILHAEIDPALIHSLRKSFPVLSNIRLDLLP